MHRFAMAVLVLVLLMPGCKQVAGRLFRAGFDTNLNTDLRDELDDGLHVLLCGAGGPLPDPNRGGPCVAVIAGRQIVLVDAGSGAARSLPRYRIGPPRVERVLLTHFHSDHIDGLGELATLRWAGGSHRSPLPVHGATGVSRVTAGFNEAYALDARYRVAHHGEETTPSSGAGVVAYAFEAPPPGKGRVIHDREGLTITAFSVEHDPVVPAVGYRFDYGGRSAVVSGDTLKSASLTALAQGVDLLVHEALAAHMVAVMNEVATEQGRVGMAKITSDIPDYHATPVQAAEVAEAAGAKHLLFHHVVPPLPLSVLEGWWLEGVGDAYAGPVTLGRDGILVSLPANSDVIEVDEL